MRTRRSICSLSRLLGAAAILSACSTETDSSAHHHATVTGPAAGVVAPVMLLPFQGLTSIPLGDGNQDTVGAAVGKVFVCSSFLIPPGAKTVSGPWINKPAATWNRIAKPSVGGDVSHRYNSLTFTRTVFTWYIDGSGIPDHTTGTFPISTGDPVYTYDKNPNPILAKWWNMNIPAMPVYGAPKCLPGGAIGMMLSGAVLYNALDNTKNDAGAHEIQDHCQGHPDGDSTYHYHALSTCIDDGGLISGHSNLVGYAFDGFGIYGHRGEKGQVLKNADLDVCHGHTHAIDWMGTTTVMYHYHATWEYPYTLGCFRGNDQSPPNPLLPWTSRR